MATFEETTFSDEVPTGDAIQVRAQFLRAIYEGEAIMVDHEEIPDFMPAMRMPLMLERPDLISGLSEGDKVLLTIGNSSVGPGLIITAIERLPPETELDLEGSGADSAFVPPGL